LILTVTEYPKGSSPANSRKSTLPPLLDQGGELFLGDSTFDTVNRNVSRTVSGKYLEVYWWEWAMRLKKPDYVCQHTFLPILGQDSVVFDFGANHGEFSHAIISRYGARVYAAEPVPELFRSIKRHPNLSLLNVAIGGENTTLRINVFADRCASMLEKINDDEAAEAVDIECLTLANFKARAGVQHIDLLKVDIEGAELWLFENLSEEELRCVNQITVEFHDFVYKELHSRVEAIKRKLMASGFWVMPFSRDNTDVLFVNKGLRLSILQRLWLRVAVKYWRGCGRLLKRQFKVLPRPQAG